VVQVDALYSDFYETVGKGKAEKLRALGGASCAYLAVDKYTGHCCEGGLVAPGGILSVDIVKAVADSDACRTGGVSVKVVATDVGLTSLGVYLVSKGATQKFLQERGIRRIVAPPYEHNVSTEVVERDIQTVKSRMRMAWTGWTWLGWTEGIYGDFGARYLCGPGKWRVSLLAGRIRRFPDMRHFGASDCQRWIYGCFLFSLWRRCGDQLELQERYQVRISRICMCGVCM
jgi:hypothetical protein